MQNFKRFFKAFNALPYHDDELKSQLVLQYTRQRTTHLHEMQPAEYLNLCLDLENLGAHRERLRHQRSIALHLMQQLGINTAVWQRVNLFTSAPRIAGKPFGRLTLTELQTLQRKLRAIQRHGGLRKPTPAPAAPPASFVITLNNNIQPQ